MAKRKPMGPQFSVQPSYFPSRWLVWDHRKGDNLRGTELDAKNPPRHPWFGRMSTAQRIVDRLNAQES